MPCDDDDDDDDVAQDLVTGARAGNLVKLCNEKFHPGINAVLAAAGSPSLDGGGIASESSRPPPPFSPPCPARVALTAPRTMVVPLSAPASESQHQSMKDCAAKAAGDELQNS